MSPSAQRRKLQPEHLTKFTGVIYPDLQQQQQQEQMALKCECSQALF